MAGGTDRQRAHLNGSVKAQIIFLVLAAMGIALLIGIAVLSWLETTA